MPPIEYRPPVLEQILQFRPRQLRNRDGYAQAFSGGTVVWQDEGPMLEVHGRALRYFSTHPGHHVIVTENSCNLSGNPFQ